MATSPNYASTPTVGAATLNTADSSRTTPASSQAIFTPVGSNGAEVERIVIEPLGTTTTTVVRIFRFDGTNYHLYTEVQLQVQTASGTVAITPQTLEAVNYPNLFPIAIPAGWSLRATINDAQAPGLGVKVQAEGGSY